MIPESSGFSSLGAHFTRYRECLPRLNPPIRRQGTGDPGYAFLYYFAIGDFDKGLEFYRQAYDILDPILVAAPGFLPENYTSDPALIAQMELPDMKELFDIRRKHRANGDGPLT